LRAECPMKTLEVESRSGIDGWAERQLADYDARRPGTMFAEGVRLSLSEAYELQGAVAALRQRRGEEVVGYKVGCTSPRIRAQLGVDQPVFGRLYGSERYASGATLSLGRYEKLAIEGELAVELAADVPDGIAPRELRGCIARSSR